MPHYPAQAQIFQALGDPTRLSIVQALAAGPRTVGDLADGSRMSLPAFLQHVRLLERAGLIRSQKIGRSRVCHLRPEPLHRATAWIETQCPRRDRRLDSPDVLLASPDPDGDFR